MRVQPRQGAITGLATKTGPAFPHPVRITPSAGRVPVSQFSRGLCIRAPFRLSPAHAPHGVIDPPRRRMVPAQVATPPRDAATGRVSGASPAQPSVRCGCSESGDRICGEPVGTSAYRSPGFDLSHEAKYQSVAVSNDGESLQSSVGL